MLYLGGFSPKSLDTQMAVTVLVITSNLLALITLWETKEQRECPKPWKRYEELAVLPKVSVGLFALTAIYFFYFACSQRDRNIPGIPWLVLANGLVLAASCIKADQLLLHPNAPATAIVSEEE